MPLTRTKVVRAVRFFRLLDSVFPSARQRLSMLLPVALSSSYCARLFAAFPQGTSSSILDDVRHRGTTREAVLAYVTTPHLRPMPLRYFLRTEIHESRM